MEIELTTHRQLFHYLLATHAADDVEAEKDAEITSFKQLEGIYAVSYSEVLWKRDYVVVVYTMSHF